jgi:hypothetical protein
MEPFPKTHLAKYNTSMKTRPGSCDQDSGRTRNQCRNPSSIPVLIPASSGGESARSLGSIEPKRTDIFELFRSL